MIPSALEVTLALIIALLSIGLVYTVAIRPRGGAPVAAEIDSTKYQSAIFLFDDEELVDATDLASWLIDEKFDPMSEWDALMLLLKDDFPDFESRIAELDKEPTLQLSSLFDHNLLLSVRKIQRRLRIELKGIDRERTPDLIQKLEQKSKQAELDRLRSITDATPQLIWQEDRNGNLLWCNQSYLRFADLHRDHKDGSLRIWPTERLFPDLRCPDSRSNTALQSRQSLGIKQEDVEHWFNIASFPNEEGVIHFAADANEEMRSERNQKAFIQTFAKTFAQLSVGLAIFDKSRNLTMFNPAMLEMMGLPVSFLSTRPSLETVFDRMRAIGKLPEPKDYIAWRDQFIALMDQNKRDGYQDTWALPDGQVYRVTGRPHPDGAFAFLFEDISAEVSLTRRFRTEIETTQAVLDALEDPIAVFSPSLTMVLTNQSYLELWNTPDDTVAAPELKGVLRSWERRSAPTSLWSELQAFATRAGERAVWDKEFLLRDGRIMVCHVSPLPGSMTMVRFGPPTKTGPSRQSEPLPNTVIVPGA